ncbi:MAG: LL-diaminopimelate aminotransferase [Treponema sp.]|jgi:LL-diaminopimelate aminotransferase|nr:LL-diaminopimelate aminotransferase [Treponema sp.]
MIARNKAFANLTAGYLFPEITKRRKAYAASHRDKKIISLGIGNTTEPLTPHIAAALAGCARDLGTPEGYSGYGDEQGMAALREKIAQTLYPGLAASEEIFISDGAKCDIARLQLLFGPETSVAVQDPAYPVYVDGSVIAGAAGGAKPGQTGYEGITYMPCTRENGFFPDLSVVKPDSLIYFCSPNNPTGAVSTKAELQTLVDAARRRGCIIVFDAAYSAFIRDKALPKTIFEIEGARECAVEVNSFSKLAGFTGVRLGWSVVPKTLHFADGEPVCQDWNRVMTTLFNGASNIAQAGGLAALDVEGMRETRSLADYYLKNAAVVKKALEGDNFKRAGVTVFGGRNSPYLWARFPGQKSWNVFDCLLADCSIVTTPGSGFGPAGESYIRFSAFGHRADAEEAAGRLANFAPKSAPDN